MVKKEIRTELTSRGIDGPKSWTKYQLTEKNERMKQEGRIGITISKGDCIPYGNWTTAKDWFPLVELDQDFVRAKVTKYETNGYQKKASIELLSFTIDRSTDGKAAFIRGKVHCGNWMNRKASGEQAFCYAIFVGDSGALYLHRAAATKGWMEAVPETIYSRLRKLGCGTDNALQQGDFLLVPLKGARKISETRFLHEFQGSGNHRFADPVLSVIDSTVGRVVMIPEGDMGHLFHTTTDGLQHPDCEIPPGQYRISTTSASLRVEGFRD